MLARRVRTRIQFSRCYLAGGPVPASDNPETCNECPGHRTALKLYREYANAGGTPATDDMLQHVTPMRDWAKGALCLPNALAWGELRAWCKSNLCL